MGKMKFGDKMPSVIDEITVSSTSTMKPQVIEKIVEIEHIVEVEKNVPGPVRFKTTTNYDDVIASIRQDVCESKYNYEVKYAEIQECNEDLNSDINKVKKDLNDYKDRVKLATAMQNDALSRQKRINKALGIAVLCAITVAILL